MRGRITALEPAGKKARTVDVYVDGEVWRTANGRAARRAGFSPGVEITPSLLASLLEEERLLAEEISLRLLTYRARSRAEVRKRLSACGICPETIERQIGRLERLGYLSDERFARNWIDDRMRVKRYGRTRIALELRARGVDPEIIERELEARCPAEGETERATDVLRDRPSLLYEDGVNATGKRRAWEWLVRRGFSSETARQAVRRVSSEDHER